MKNVFGAMNYRTAILVYVVLMLGLASPYLVFGEVIAPNRQHAEVGLNNDSGSSGRIENRKFSDYTHAYIPEISEHLKGPRSTWLTLWTNKNELGRPTFQISGLGPAYFPSWIIARITESPWWFITSLSLSICFLGGFFVILLCRELELAPLAGLTAGTSLAASPLFMYWLTFPMFAAVWCWCAGALWAITRLAKMPDLIGWSVLAFSGYSLLMAAYPQPVVYHIYLIGGYCLYLAFRKCRAAIVEMVRFLALAGSAVTVGAALALPAYRDLVVAFFESARLAPDPSFFTLVLPRLTNVGEAVGFFVLGTVPELFGNPVTSVYPFPYDGLTVTLVVVFFAAIGLLTSFQQTWGWWLAIAVLCLFAFLHPLYAFGVKYLGFNLSRSTPLGSIMLPLTVIVAFGVDALVKRIASANLPWVVLFASVAVAGIVAAGVAYGISVSIPIRWGMVLLMAMLTSVLAAQYRTTRPSLVVAALVMVLATTSYPLMLRQDPAEIATSSPLLDKVRANLPKGTRFAVASPGILALPPNSNASLGLSSAHSYNSLSARRYHTLITGLGGEIQTYGRLNDFISPDYGGALFWMSNIGLMLSPKKLAHENLEYLGEESGVHLYKVISRMGDSLQVDLSRSSTGIGGSQIADPRGSHTHLPVKLEDQGDALEFEIVPMTSAVLVLSQKFHRDWQANALTPQGWSSAQTIEVNGVFQGVLLPQDSTRVRLEFKPLVRYAWIAHVFWLLLLILLAFEACRRGGAGALSRYK